MVDSIETAQMYDGRNTVDRYVCKKCGNQMFTTYKDKGVTPFTVVCRDCKGTMYHDGTYPMTSIPSCIQVLKWYRPSLEQTLRMNESQIWHILHGGLVLDEKPDCHGQKLFTEEEIGVIKRLISGDVKEVFTDYRKKMSDKMEKDAPECSWPTILEQINSINKQRII